MPIQVTNPVSKTSVTALQSCREIPFEVVSEADSTLRNVPMTSGLCVPRGTLQDAGEWLVEGLGGSQHPVQTEVLNRWSDGSVRWLLAHFVAGKILSGRTNCQLVRPEHRVQRAAGSASLRWDRDTVTLLTAGSEVRFTPELNSSNGERLQLEITNVTSETTGDVRCVYLAEVKVLKTPFINLQLRMEVWPSAGLLKFETIIRNTRRAQHKGGLWDLGDAGSFGFSGLHLSITGVFGHGARLTWKTEQQASTQTCPVTESLCVVQYGSGSAAWSNTNHNNADDQPTVLHRGYQAATSSGIVRGNRSEPTLSIETEDERISIAVPEFWQQFPGSLSVIRNTISVGLFPTEVATGYELQGGEQKTLSAWISTRKPAAHLEHLKWVYQPPRIIPPLRWVKHCNVFSWLPETNPAAVESGAKFDAYIREATSGDCSFAARRDTIDEYGWRNFGDVPANHEQTHYAGTNTIISHYNNQFDLIYGGILNLLTSGESKWFDLLEPLSRHVMDIDLYHTSEDRGCFNGGLFWHTDHYVDARTATHRTYSRHNTNGKDSYGGGPSNEHNYTTGLLYYYFLTGNREASASVLTLANWVMSMDDGSLTIWGLLDSGDTGLASQTVFEDFHGPGRGVGNSINALLDAWIITRDDKYMTKAEQLIHRAVHPNQNCDALHLADAEGHWSYTVCLTALGRYLETKLEAGQIDKNYVYVRETLAHYGRWMTVNEKPALSEPEKLEYPTEAWAAQEFRKANVLRIAASCTDNANEEAAMRQKADVLNDAAWKDLYAFERQHLTARCLSIVMIEGQRDVFHRSCRPEYMPPAEHTYTWDEWSMFIPQKHRVKQILKDPVRLAVAAMNVLNPVRIVRAIDAVRRQV
jgi:hypothetical protein